MLTWPVGVRAAVFGEEVGDGMTERKQAVEVEEAVRRGSVVARGCRRSAATSGGGEGIGIPIQIQNDERGWEGEWVSVGLGFREWGIWGG